MRRPRLAFAAVASILGVACATATAPLGGGGTDGEDTTKDGGGSRDGGGGNVYGGSDGGSTNPKDGGLKPLPPSDAGTTTPLDSGTTIVPDSGTTTSSDFCVGQTSSEQNDYGNFKYDDWCYENASFDNSAGNAFACATSADCTTQFTVPACCYKPKSGGDCRSIYGTTPQCVIQ